MSQEDMSATAVQDVDLMPLSDLSDEALVTSHLEGRPGAFQELYDRYRDRLVHFITVGSRPKVIWSRSARTVAKRMLVSALNSRAALTFSRDIVTPKFWAWVRSLENVSRSIAANC